MYEARIEQLKTDLDRLERELVQADEDDDRVRIMDLETLCYATSKRIDILKARAAVAG